MMIIHNDGDATTSPIAVGPMEAARLAGVGRTMLYQAIASGDLRSLKIGRRRLIKLSELEAWLDAQS